MELSSRLFNCALCHIQCVICSPCDNGQIYCSPDCSRSARKKSCNEGEKRYQQTPKGKLNHALRQKRYRERECKIVTDHTCQTSSECDPFSSIGILNALFPSGSQSRRQSLVNQILTTIYSV